jgi:hypothetical protein
MSPGRIRVDGILIERSAMGMSGFSAGERVVVRDAAGEKQALRLAGLPRAPIWDRTYLLRGPLDRFVPLEPGAIWLALVVVLGPPSRLYPAWRASHLTVRGALAHA